MVRFPKTRLPAAVFSLFMVTALAADGSFFSQYVKMRRNTTVSLPALLAVFVKLFRAFFLLIFSTQWSLRRKKKMFICSLAKLCVTVTGTNDFVANVGDSGTLLYMLNSNLIFGTFGFPFENLMALNSA